MNTSLAKAKELEQVEARSIFEREIGSAITGVEIETIGTEEFLKFIVGRESPIYQYALQKTQLLITDTNSFRGRLGLIQRRIEKFPSSTEASCLSTLLTRSTKAISENETDDGFLVPYAPFQNREDHQLAQPASHVVLGRRGVGKSTLIKRAKELLSKSSAIVAVLDMQTYSTLSEDDIYREVIYDTLIALSIGVERTAKAHRIDLSSDELRVLASRVSEGALVASSAAPAIKRCLKAITAQTKDHVFLFLDDFHLVDFSIQPKLLHALNALLKGANGWLKVAGVRTLTNYYSSTERCGLQIPGDAQEISLDLTLENPEAAEKHLRVILDSFFHAVGYEWAEKILPNAAFKRLVWANAGVPRDFLQMFARALEHAKRNQHSSVTVSDVNIAIGEFGQQKANDLQVDARNESGELTEMVSRLERYCLDDWKTNAFLVKSEDSDERRRIRKLSDLRYVHLIHQSITPAKAGERYEAFILDYSLFTGFRRRPNIREMLPSHGQFKASELRKLPKVSSGSLL